MMIFFKRQILLSSEVDILSLDQFEIIRIYSRAQVTAMRNSKYSWKIYVPI